MNKYLVGLKKVRPGPISLGPQFLGIYLWQMNTDPEWAMLKALANYRVLFYFC